MRHARHTSSPPVLRCMTSISSMIDTTASWLVHAAAFQAQVYTPTNRLQIIRRQRITKEPSSSNKRERKAWVSCQRGTEERAVETSIARQSWLTKSEADRRHITRGAPVPATAVRRLPLAARMRGTGAPAARRPCPAPRRQTRRRRPRAQLASPPPRASYRQAAAAGCAGAVVDACLDAVACGRAISQASLLEFPPSAHYTKELCSPATREPCKWGTALLTTRLLASTCRGSPSKTGGRKR